MAEIKEIFPELSWCKKEQLEKLLEYYKMKIFNNKENDLVVGKSYSIIYDDMSHGMSVNVKCIWNGEHFIRDFDKIKMCGVYAYTENN